MSAMQPLLLRDSVAYKLCSFAESYWVFQTMQIWKNHLATTFWHTYVQTRLFPVSHDTFCVRNVEHYILSKKQSLHSL